MDIEDFGYEELKDELLKIVDEMFNRGFSEEEIEELLIKMDTEK